MKKAKLYGNLGIFFTLQTFMLLIGAPYLTSIAGEKLAVQLRDFTRTEVKSGGFIVPNDAHLHIKALGAGVSSRNGFSNNDNDMFAYGWILNADTREVAWEMTRDNTSSSKSDREFDGDVTLPRGSYEVYFAAYAFAVNSPFSNFSINIDRRKDFTGGSKSERPGFFSWLYNFFGEDMDKEWTRRAKNWGVDVSITSGDNNEVQTFSAPKPFHRVFYQSVKVGENEHITQAFSISERTPIRIYALGEMGTDREASDYAWILNAKTRERTWEMRAGNTSHAGGAEKNIKYDNTIEFPAGEYILYYVSDDSHSYLDWNQAPPYDPYNYGITLMAASEGTDGNFKLHSVKDEQNIIAQLIRVRDSETRSESFGLKSDIEVRIYALGERSNAHSQMSDFGWIINNKTREKVWSMDEATTEHAGGASKNRMVDDIINLPKGSYTVYYQTDDSHSYNHWNSSPPYDPEHWGISIYAVDDKDMEKVEKNITPKQEGILAQIVKVGDSADKTAYFKLDKPTHVRVYALGEGQSGEMFDYGWIEKESNGEHVWEMSYGMTFHAGGARKNRIVNTTILLDKGKYKLRYTSDDSHSYENWNSDPPDDRTMWGITLYEDEH